MTDRLADVSARIEGIRQLGAVVNAMKGIAAARAHLARAQTEAVDSYAATIAAAMSSVMEPGDTGQTPEELPDQGKTGLLVFAAEQGFAGALSERVLDSIGAEESKACLFLIGTRGLSIAAARGLQPEWSAPLPSRTPGIPKLADSITKAVYLSMQDGKIDRLDGVHTALISGRPQIARTKLFPINLTDFPPRTGVRPLLQLAPDTIFVSLSADYFHAMVCKAALHAFAAENEVRLAAMTAAGNQIASELEVFQATLRRVRQEAITAEIIELGTGAETARAGT